MPQVRLTAPAVELTWDIYSLFVPSDIYSPFVSITPQGSIPALKLPEPPFLFPLRRRLLASIQESLAPIRRLRPAQFFSPARRTSFCD